jgi:hypothetical protein
MQTRLPKITRVWWTCEYAGETWPVYPYMHIEFADGREGIVDWELKLLRKGYDAVFLGPHFEPYTQWTLPPDPADGRTLYTTLRGFTDDPRVVALAKEFLVIMQEGKFEVGIREGDVPLQ